MKMSPAKYAVLRRDVGKFVLLDEQPSKKAEERARWDAFWLAVKEGLSIAWVYDGGLDDEHIDTALRRIVREVRASHD